MAWPGQHIACKHSVAILPGTKEAPFGVDKIDTASIGQSSRVQQWLVSYSEPARAKLHLYPAKVEPAAGHAIRDQRRAATAKMRMEFLRLAGILQPASTSRYTSGLKPSCPRKSRVSRLNATAP
jgi:hypothetical protein